MSDEIVLGGNRRYAWDWPEPSLDEPLPPPPTFDEDMEAVTQHARKIVGKVKHIRDLATPHLLIAKALAVDEQLRAEYTRTGYSWYRPKYDSPIEQRRLRLLNSIFSAAQRLGCKPQTNTSRHGEDRSASVCVGDNTVPINIEPVNRKSADKSSDRSNARLRLTLTRKSEQAASEKRWEDSDNFKIENGLTEILIEILVSGERNYRQGCLHRHAWLVEHRKQREENLRRARAEAERKARELREAEEKARIDGLIAQSNSLDQARTIRGYVDAVRARGSELGISANDLGRWAAWALAEADRIDPVKNGIVLDAIVALSSKNNASD